MSDLGVLVPILAPSGFGTRQSAASNTAESGDRSTVSAVSGVSVPSIDTSAAAQGVRPVDPLTGLAITGLAITGLTAGLVPVLQEAEDREGSPGNAAPSEGEAAEGQNGDAPEGGESTEEDAPAAAQPAGNGAGPTGLTPEQQQVVQELERTDAEIRRHEQAHASAGGPYAGAPSYDYTRGPDGRLYAIGGDVQIDAAVVPGNPEATIRKMQIVRRAALAPASPSPQDQRVAAIAQQRIIEARREQSELEIEEREAAAAERAEAQERAARLQPASGSAVSGGDTAGGSSEIGPQTSAPVIPALVNGATAVTGPVVTPGEILNVIA